MDGRVEMRIRATPGAPRTAIRGVVDGVLRVRLAAPPVDGAANDELVRFLARDVLRIPRAQVALHAGAASRDKVVRIDAPEELVRTAIAAATT